MRDFLSINSQTEKKNDIFFNFLASINDSKNKNDVPSFTLYVTLAPPTETKTFNQDKKFFKDRLNENYVFEEPYNKVY